MMRSENYTCDICQTGYSLIYTTKRHRIKNGIPLTHCKDCIEKARVAKMSETYKEVWKNTSDEKRNNRISSLQIAHNNYITDPENREISRSRMKLEMKNNPNRLYKLHSDWRNWRDSLSDETKRQRSIQQSQRERDRLNSLSTDERLALFQKQSQLRKDHWSSLSENEKRIQQYKIAISKAELARAKPITNEVELKFQSILDELNIPY